MSNSAKTFPRAICMKNIGLHRYFGALWKKPGTVDSAYPWDHSNLSRVSSESVSCLISKQPPRLEGIEPEEKAKLEDNQAGPRQLGLFLRSLIDVFISPPTMNEDVTLPNPCRFSGFYFRRQSIFQRLFYDTVSAPILALVGPTVALTARWKGPASLLGETLRCTCAHSLMGTDPSLSV